jgi:hypothetical protein
VCIETLTPEKLDGQESGADGEWNISLFFYEMHGDKIFPARGGWCLVSDGVFSVEEESPIDCGALLLYLPVELSQSIEINSLFRIERKC